MAQHLTYSTGIVYTPTLLDAVTETTTSKVQLVAGAKGVGIELTGAGTIADRTATLTITASLDGGTNYQTYNMLIDNVASSDSESIYTHVADKDMSSDGTNVLWLDPVTLPGITHIKATVTIDDTSNPAGNFTVKAVITY